MASKRLFIAVAISIASGMFAAAPASETKVDFDRVFADAARQGEFDPLINDELRRVGWNFIVTATERGSLAGIGYVNRAHKSDRLPKLKSALPEPELLPYCEPVASPFADPILGRIAGRCAA